MKLYYNDSTKIVFGSADVQTDPAVREITRDEIPNLIANGATVDPSADNLGNVAPVAPVLDASATGLATVGEQGNVLDSSAGIANDSTTNATSGPTAEQAVVVDHESILGRLLDELEGIVHMGKSEIVAVIDRARTAIKV